MCEIVTKENKEGKKLEICVANFIKKENIGGKGSKKQKINCR